VAADTSKLVLQELGFSVANWGKKLAQGEVVVEEVLEIVVSPLRGVDELEVHRVVVYTLLVVA
jgi:hypothetical protein